MYKYNVCVCFIKIAIFEGNFISVSLSYKTESKRYIQLNVIEKKNARVVLFNDFPSFLSVGETPKLLEI